MPSPFDVTVVPTSLTLKPGEVGELEVTVSNRSGQALTARPIRVADPKTALDWLQPKDKDEAPLSNGETRKFRFGVTVPAGTPTQTVKVRVDVADVTDPDRFFAQGQTVAVTVAMPVVNGKPRPKWWVYAVAAVVVLAVGFGIVKIVTHKGGGTPGVVRLNADTAQARLKAAGLGMTRTDTLSTDTVAFKAGTVVRQTPDSGKSLPKDKTVSVAVQKPWAVVPPFLANTPFTLVGTAISSRGLLITARTAYNANAALSGRVQSVTPGAGTVLARGDAVTVTVWTNVSNCTPAVRCLSAEVSTFITQYNMQARQYKPAAPVIH